MTTTSSSLTGIADAQQVYLQRPHPNVALITLKNPPRNALSFEGRRQLLAILRELESDDSVRCLAVTGDGPTFTAGNDLRQDEAMSVDEVDEFLDGFSDMLRALHDFRCPVVGIINGGAVGGGLEFALCCDVRIAATDAVFVAAGVNVGLVANFYLLPRIVGEGPAKDLLLTGRRWSAEEALRWGLVTALHPTDELLGSGLQLAERIATRAPLSVEVTKEAVHRVRHASAEAAAELQRSRFKEMFETEDHAEAVRAFFERRSGTYHRR